MGTIISGGVMIAFGIGVLVTRQVSVSNGSQSAVMTGKSTVGLGVVVLVAGIVTVIVGLVNIT
jgi:hypothetical protein